MTEQSNIVGYQCIRCGLDHPAETFRYCCKSCNENLDVVYNYSRISTNWSKKELSQNPDRSLWRYLPLLPVQRSPENHSLQVGGTPLVTFKGFTTQVGEINLYLKDDTRNPSSSLKDRATEIGIQHAEELGKDTLIAASTGNAAASLAALAAFYGTKAVILAPAAAPRAKLTQILQHGANLCLVDGNYDAAFELSLQISEAFGWYSRSTGINPMLSEGKKTVILEIAEQMQWQVPDKIFVPVGDGCIIGGVYKGFYDLLQLGWIDHLPQIIAVQAEGSAAIVEAVKSNLPIKTVKSTTIADSISVDFPRDGLKALRAVIKSNGFGMTVTDDQILAGQKNMATQLGIFAEPAAAAAYAGFLKALHEDRIKSGESVVLLITGSGLKDIPAAQKKITISEPVSPDLNSFKVFYDRLAKENQQ